MRERLPERRARESFDFEHAGYRYNASLGFYPDGRLGEVFIASNKVGTPIQIVAIEAAVAVSIALQHGADPAVIRDALPRGPDGRAAGLLGALLDRLDELQRPVIVHKHTNIQDGPRP